MDRWEGKVAVVTGASSGIGKSIATELVERGMIVVGLARRMELVQDLSNSLTGRKGKLFAVKADVGKEDDVAEAFDWVRKNLGGVHVLVNNAGIGTYSLLSNMDREEYKRVQACLNTNVMGVVMCSNEAIKLMREKGIVDGHIININSVLGHFISRRLGIHFYNATKHAVTVLTEGLRRELVEAKSKIRVTSISPGFVLTNIMDGIEVPNRNEIMANSPILRTDDVTNSVIHSLAAPADVQIAEIIVRPVGEEA
ncbi:farnesol dehydrogenase-like [Ischnura elegans]|uniref:farnesol dehydrogenase-like n=1 Tax=Ischnura elegans TaxID=197161 RepID=UPI001ED8A722|nr:farnesol dehydrogenase-like [Ischnura elegans]XP_046393898.1 farnesol dehydrogenase-like [Ischnura elegans]